MFVGVHRFTYAALFSIDGSLVAEDFRYNLNQHRWSTYFLVFQATIISEETYVGAFGEDISSRRSGVNSIKRKACCGELCVKRMLRAACVDIFLV